MFLPIHELLLSIQNALGNAVTPELRAVTADIDEKNGNIVLYFFYNGEVTERLAEIASIAGTETNVGGYLNEEHIVRLDFPKPIPIRGKLAFLRKEPVLPKYEKGNRSFLLEDTCPLSVLCLDMQEALLGKVTPPLRLVTVGVDPDKKCLRFQFVYDGAISDEDFALATAAIQEASVSFPGYEIDSRIERIDSPEETSAYGQQAAYWRREMEF